jgi:hypothetical protein
VCCIEVLCGKNLLCYSADAVQNPQQHSTAKQASTAISVMAHLRSVTLPPQAVALVLEQVKLRLHQGLVTSKVVNQRLVLLACTSANAGTRIGLGG